MEPSDPSQDQRWRALLDEAGAVVEAEAGRDLWDEVAERTRYELGRVRLEDRLRAAAGVGLRWHLADGSVREASVSPAGSGAHGPEGRWARTGCVGGGWALVAEAGGSTAVVPLCHVDRVDGLGNASLPPQGSVDGGPDLRSVMRMLARDRVPVRLHLRGGDSLEGSLSWVGLDFVDVVLPGVPGARRSGSGARTVTMDAVVWIGLARGRTARLG